MSKYDMIQRCTIYLLTPDIESLVFYDSEFKLVLITSSLEMRQCFETLSVIKLPYQIPIPNRQYHDDII